MTQRKNLYDNFNRDVDSSAKLPPSFRQIPFAGGFASARNFNVIPDLFRKASARLPLNSILRRYCFRTEFGHNSKSLQTPSACLPHNSNPQWLCFRRNLTEPQKFAGRPVRLGNWGSGFRGASALLPNRFRGGFARKVEKNIIQMNPKATSRRRLSSASLEMKWNGVKRIEMKIKTKFTFRIQLNHWILIRF